MKAKCSLGLNTIEDLWCRNCLLPMTGYETIFYWWIPMVPATLNACQCPPPGIDVPWTWYLAGKPISDQWCLIVMPGAQGGMMSRLPGTRLWDNVGYLFFLLFPAHLFSHLWPSNTAGCIQHFAIYPRGMFQLLSLNWECSFKKVSFYTFYLWRYMKKHACTVPPT